MQECAVTPISCDRRRSYSAWSEYNIIGVRGRMTYHIFSILYPNNLFLLTFKCFHPIAFYVKLPNLMYVQCIYFMTNQLEKLEAARGA